jgi:hypothetical protein
MTNQRSHLRELLLDAGVTTKWSTRELARRSDYKLSKDFWWRVATPIPPGQRGCRWDIDDLKVAADTLTRLGASVTFARIERAVLADLGYSSDRVTDLAQSLASVIGDLVDRVAALEALTSRRKPLADWTQAELRAVVRAEFAKPPLTP